MDTESFIAQSRPFLSWLVAWYNDLDTIELDSLAGDPTKVAIISVDVINGFCYEGPLASPRVRDIVAPIAALIEAAWSRGVRHIALPQDAHQPDAIEFAQWGPHCVRGTREAETVDALKKLPFFPQLTVFEKNSISSSIDTDLGEWLDDHPEIATFIVVGDCTDLCTYQLAMFLRLRANARQLGGVRVILPANCVNTYDLPVEAAQQTGAVPHDGDFLHLVFLYSMMLNGVTVVRQIAF
ncbi:MAG: cysteine hydrolase [Anaerolineae bacterium]